MHVRPVIGDPSSVWEASVLETVQVIMILKIGLELERILGHPITNLVAYVNIDYNGGKIDKKSISGSC